MPKYWMIDDRNQSGTGTAPNACGLNYWVTDNGPLNNIANWTSVTANKFQTPLAAAADEVPAIPPGENIDHSHLTISVQTYTVSCEHPVSFYEILWSRFFDGPNSLGVLYSPRLAVV